MPAKRKPAPTRLGVDTDTAIAAQLGVSVSAVAQRRRRQGIARAPDPRRIAWTPAADALLGTAPDREVAQQLGATRDAVARRRLALGVRSYDAAPPRKAAAELAGAEYAREVRAGKLVADVAREHGITHATVRAAIARYDARRGKRRAGA